MASPELFKVIVIDESMHRQLAVKNMLPWKELNCDIVAFAQNNKDAYRLYSEIRPQIIILGVTGRRLDRIPLIHQIRRNDRDVQILLVMDTFQYFRVRSYIRAGISDLLLGKALSPEGLRAAVEEAKAKSRQMHRMSRDQERGAMRELQQCFLLHKEDHSSSVQDFAQVLDHPFYEFVHDGIVMAYLRVDQIHLIGCRKRIDRAELRMQMEAVLNENRPDSVYSLTLFLNQHSAVMLFQTSDCTQVQFIVRSLLNEADRVISEPMSVIVSEPVDDAAGMMAQFDRMIECSRTRFYQQDRVLDLRESRFSFRPLNKEAVSFHADLLDAVSAHDFAAVRTIQKQMLSYMEEHQIDPQDVKAYCSFVLHNVEGRELSFGIRKSFPYEDASKLIALCETMGALEQILDEIWDEVETWLSEKANSQYRRDVTEWIEYIHRNIHRKLTLQEVADHFDVSASYASRLFKQETGKNIIYYINETKMKEALPLLDKSELSIHEIAARVGVEDPFYFNRLFRRFYGMVPREYRKKIRGEKE